MRFVKPPGNGNDFVHENFREAFSFMDIVYKYNPYYLTEHYWWTGETDVLMSGEKLIFLRANEHIIAGTGIDGNTVYSSAMVPALIVVDNNPIGKSYEMIATMPASDTLSVTFMRGDQGFGLYGQKTREGVVLVTTKMGARTDGSMLGRRSHHETTIC